MAGGVVTVGRRQYACGLYWENSPSGRVTQTAKEAARQPSVQAEYYAVRPGNKNGRVPQFALSQEGSSHRTGLPVLSACIANQQPGSWVGAFRLREGTAVIIVRDDLIVPDGDLFFTDETEARDRLLQEMALGGLQKAYAPETWGISGSDSMPVSLLLNDSTEIKLKPVAIPRSTLMFMLGMGGVLLLLLGIGWYLHQKAAEEEALRLAQEEALLRLQAEAQNLMPGMAPQPVYPPPERTWEKKPRPMELVEACNETLKKVPLTVAGWRLDTITCTEAGISEKWSRTGSFSAPPPGSLVDDAANSATVDVQISKTLSPRGDEKLKDPEDITRRYLAQNWPGTLSRAPDDPPPPPPPNYQGEWNPPPAPWIKRSFTLSTPILPGSLPVFLEDLPGVIINNLTYALSGVSGTWNVDGVIYENRH